MILTTNILLDKYRQFADPHGKIRRLTQKGELVLLTKGLYTDDEHISGFYAAGAIYGPSYISFNTALSYWGMIPEAVYTVTSATTRKLKKKYFSNKIGDFTYRDIPPAAYPFGIKIIEENGYRFLIASKEKALCDKLYEIPPIQSQKELIHVLFDDMRLDQDLFSDLNRDDIYFIVEKYRSNNLRLLEKYLRRIHHEYSNR